MNSDDEKAIFEARGWAFDSVQRAWFAPDGYTVSVDTLMVVRDLFGARKWAAHLRAIAEEHGCAT